MMTARLTAIETRVATGRAAKAGTGFTGEVENVAGTAPRGAQNTGDTSGYRTACDRRPTPQETRALQAPSRI